MTQPEPELRYRYEDYLESNYDPWDDIHYPATVRVHLRTFLVERKTPCGVWINDGWRDRFINNNTKKQFACATKEEAAISFRARKKAQIKLLQSRLSHAETALALPLEPAE